MRRRRRIVLKVIEGAFAVLFMQTLVLWVWSLNARAELGLTSRSNYFQFAAARGSLFAERIALGRVPAKNEIGYRWGTFNLPPPLHRRYFFGGFRFHNVHLYIVQVQVPLWIPAAVCAIGMIVLNRKTRIARSPFQCLTCGYDLRATPEDQSRYPLNYASRFGAD